MGIWVSMSVIWGIIDSMEIALVLLFDARHGLCSSFARLFYYVIFVSLKEFS